MNLLSKLRKPNWQSSNAQKRAAAVASEDSPELIAALPRLAIDDPDSEVRRQALRRCDDSALYVRAATADVDVELRSWARQRWLQNLQQCRATLDDAVLSALSRDEIERLAAQLASPDDRRRLLARVDRPGFLAERALGDPDPALRLEVLQRIDQVSTLERIAEQARKHDKRLARAARERAESLKRSAGSDQAHRARAESICAALEQLMREALPGDERSARLQQHQGEWDGLEREGFPDALLARFRGACTVLSAQLAPPPVPVASRHEVEPEPEPAIAAESPGAAPSPEEIAAQVRIQAELAAQAAEAARERALEEDRRSAREQSRQQQEQRLQELGASLDDGDLGRARQLATELDPRQLGPAARSRWNQLQPRLKQLQGWEHWANNKVRARLCDEIEQLIGSGLHPDALANKVREAQQRWRELDALEGRGESSEPSGLDKRFRVVCARALKPARGFFEKRDALRSERQQQIEAFLAEAGAADSEDARFEAMLDVQRQAVAHLRELGTLAPPARKRLAGRLRAVLDALKPRLESGFAEIEQARQALIDQARALAQENDPRRIGSEAKQLSQRWKEVAKGRPGRDQAQWRQFRAALDAVFGGLDTRRKEREVELGQRQEQARAVIDELEQLALLDGEVLAQSQSRGRELAQAWRELAVRDAELGEAYDSALTRLRQALRDQERDRERERYRALADVEPDAAANADGGGDPRMAALHLLFEAESIAGLGGVEDESRQRREWQMQRLQQHLRGERAEGTQGLLEVLARWGQLSGLDENERSRYRARLYAVIDAVLAR